MDLGRRDLQQFVEHTLVGSLPVKSLMVPSGAWYNVSAIRILSGGFIELVGRGMNDGLLVDVLAAICLLLLSVAGDATYHQRPAVLSQRVSKMLRFGA